MAINTNSVQFFQTISEDKLPDNCEIIVAAWQLSNPENIGKIIRMAHNLGANKVLFIQGEEKHRQSKIKKTAGFSFEQMDWAFLSEEEFLMRYAAAYPIVALETCDGAKNIYSILLPSRLIVLAGSESHGIPESILQSSEVKVYIPMPGGCKSLNISNALAIASFEWYRQQIAPGIEKFS